MRGLQKKKLHIKPKILYDSLHIRSNRDLRTVPLRKSRSAFLEREREGWEAVPGTKVVTPRDCSIKWDGNPCFDHLVDLKAFAASSQDLSHTGTHKGSWRIRFQHPSRTSIFFHNKYWKSHKSLTPLSKEQDSCGSININT